MSRYSWGNESLEDQEMYAQIMLKTAFPANSEQFYSNNSIMDNIWFVLSRLKLLFYLVWPTETMFPSLDEVPRYVAEVSTY